MSTKYDSAMVIVIVLIFIRTLLRYSNLYGIDSSTSLVASAFVFFVLIISVQLLRHYAKRVLTPRSLNVKLGPRRNYHKGRAAIRHYANQTARPL